MCGYEIHTPKLRFQLREKNMYICNANMIIPFVNNRTPKKKKLNMYLNCISNSKIS